MFPVTSTISEQSVNTDVPCRREKRKSCEQDLQTIFKDANVCPFKLQWSFGLNPEVPVLNLTTEHRKMIAYVCSHAAVLYDYELKDMSLLQGHQNAVRTLSTDCNGKWLLSADFENDYVVIIWDTEIRVPICTLFNPHGTDGMTAAQLSPDAKYVVTVGNEKCQKVNFWLWTRGRDEPDASVELIDTSTDRVKHVNFSTEHPDHFILTMDRRVVFITWRHKVLHGDYPRIAENARRLGILNNSSYISKTRQALTGTGNGFVLVWNDVFDIERLDDERSKNDRRKHVKSIHLQAESITQIVDYEGMVVIGNSAGHINFYDNQLRLLYWCHNCGLDSICFVSFNLLSKLKRPRPTVSEPDLTASGCEEDEEEKVEEERKRKTPVDEENVIKQAERISSNVTMTMDFTHKAEINLLRVPSDATLRQTPFIVRNFIVCTSTGQVAWLDIPKLKCHFILHPTDAAITALDCHPDREYIVTGNAKGHLRSYKYSMRSLMVSKTIPVPPALGPIMDDEIAKHEIIYVTCPEINESTIAITALKYSPNGETLACGMESGALWILHPDTLDPIHRIPYKHSSGAIANVTFSNSSGYMAYSDVTLNVAAFKKNVRASSMPLDENAPTWHFLGKYRSHFLPIREILFGPPTGGQTTPRFLSLGEDRRLIEYDLKNSGPYPDPGLTILHIDRIEHDAVPLCLTWYPEFGLEHFLVVSNSEYKFKLLNDASKMIRKTILGPTFGAPVQQMKILPMRNAHNQAYMVFATDKEIGLQLLPFDGSPFMVVGMIGHPQKLTKMSVGTCGRVLFTLGQADRCVLMWKINIRAVDVMARLGGKYLSPFYRLIDGGRKGWLINEMQDLFYYAQILHQGENTTATRIVSDKVSTKQLPNLMRAVGFYPSNYELECMMSEVTYRNYAETGQQVEEITFKEFVKLYVNHRPTFGVSLRRLKQSFLTFDNQTNLENPTLSRGAFLDVLFGKGQSCSSKRSKEDELLGEPLTPEEARVYLSLLMSNDDNKDKSNDHDATKPDLDAKFNFLPSDISYKDFVTEILEIEPPEEMRAEVNKTNVIQ